MLHNVPGDITSEELIDAIINQNLDNNIASTDIKAIIRLTIRGSTFVNWVLEVKPVVRNKICKLSRVYINWTSVRVTDYIRILRCYNCQRFGHMARDCKSTQICSSCSDEGHDQKDCNNVDKILCCPNCKRDGLEGIHLNHSASSKECKTYIKR